MSSVNGSADILSASESDVDVPWDAIRHNLLPGGVGRISLNVGDRSPLVRRASGWWVEDTSGNRLIDTNNNMTVNLHGNAHPAIVEVVSQRMAEGLISVGIANTDELVLAEALTCRIPTAEQVRFTNSGVEAVILAIRVARASTGRDRIIVLAPGYHGTADVVLPSMGSAGLRGVPGGVSDDTITIPRNDTAALIHAFEEHGQEIAAILLDLCANRAGLTALSAEFAETAAALAGKSGAQLIIDEVVTFRSAYGGLAEVYGLTPDLTVLGKAIGGGFPIGAVVGTRTAMKPLDVNALALEHGGTFTANPISMSAGAVAMRMFDATAVARLNALGTRLEGAMRDGLDGTGWEFRRSGSVFRMWPEGWPVTARPAAQRKLFWASYSQGVLGAGSGLSALSTIMDEEVVDQLALSLLAAAYSVRAI